MGEQKRREAQGRRPPLPFETLAASTILPPDLPQEVRDLLRTMFFLGAGAHFDILMHWLQPGREATDADMRRMDRLHAELEAFRQQLASRVKRPSGPGH